MIESKTSEPLDTSVRLVTPERVEFRYPLAGPFRRSLSYLIDIVVLIASGLVRLLRVRDYDDGLARGAHLIRSDPSASPALDGRGVAARALDTALGTIFVAATPAGVIRIAFEEDAAAGRLAELARGRRGAAAARAHVDATVAALDRYLGGAATIVDCVVDWSAIDASPSNHQWFAVATTTNVTSSGYSSQSVLSQRRRARFAIGSPSIKENATCIEGTAANGL